MHQTLLALDQGTSSTRAILFDRRGKIIAQAQRAQTQTTRHDDLGWVEQEGEDIWQNTLSVCQEVLAQTEMAQVLGLGITNQRETLVTWDALTNQLLAPVIVWQDRRSADLCQHWIDQGLEPWVQKKTGLLLDPYFSATKMVWLLNHDSKLKALHEEKRLRFGTIDTFLLWRLTAGKAYATDVTNASRTLLMNLETQQWDPELLSFFKIYPESLPEIKACTADFGCTDPSLFGRALPICALIGDQQAALVGQACFTAGMAKSTYGTGCFVLMNTGAKPLYSQHRLLSTIAYSVKGELAYGLEGSIFAAGMCMQWLRDTFKLIENAGDSEAWARQIEDTQGVYLVPAFTGLGAPYWDPWARGAIIGLTRNTGMAHIIRAALEAVCYQTADLLNTMRLEGVVIQELRVDGGMTANTWLLQFLADILDCSIQRPQVIETTALGVAYLVGLQTGLYTSLSEISNLWAAEKIYQPQCSAEKRERLYQGWQEAVSRVLSSQTHLKPHAQR